MITSTQNMNTVQYIFAAVEGGVCSALAMTFIIAATTKMNLQVSGSMGCMQMEGPAGMPALPHGGFRNELTQLRRPRADSPILSLPRPAQ